MAGLRVVLLCNIVCLSTLVAAAKDELRPNQKGKGKPDRTLDIKHTGGKKVRIRSEEDSGDRFDFAFAVTGLPNLRLSYFNSSTDTNSKATFRIGMFRVSEVTDGNNAFTTDSFASLTGKTNDWTEIAQTETDIENGTLYNFSTTRVWDNGMSVTWDTLVSSSKADSVKVGSKAPLDPSSVKFSFSIHNFPYQYNESRLALVGKLFAKGVDKAHSLSDGYVLEDGSVLQWEPSVTADGREVSLASGGLRKEALTGTGEDEDDGKVAGEGNKFIAWTVDANQPKDVYWDPTLSQDETLYGETSSHLVLASATLLACALASIL